MTILVIDNYDSFAYNLVQYVGVHDDVLVRRNDAIDITTIRTLDPDAIIVSPGPGTPEAAGISVPLFTKLQYPTLGVCLGHQALCVANGTSVDHAESVVHGKSSTVTHDGNGVFEEVPDSFAAGRYHSLVVRREDLPECLIETATTDAEHKTVMGVRHTDRPHVGIQFHPESVLTNVGEQLIATFCEQHTDNNIEK